MDQPLKSKEARKARIKELDESSQRDRDEIARAQASLVNIEKEKQKKTIKNQIRANIADLDIKKITEKSEVQPSIYAPERPPKKSLKERVKEKNDKLNEEYKNHKGAAVDAKAFELGQREMKRIAQYSESTLAAETEKKALKSRMRTQSETIRATDPSKLPSSIPTGEITLEGAAALAALKRAPRAESKVEPVSPGEAEASEVDAHMKSVKKIFGITEPEPDKKSPDADAKVLKEDLVNRRDEEIRSIPKIKEFFESYTKQLASKNKEEAREAELELADMNESPLEYNLKAYRYFEEQLKKDPKSKFFQNRLKRARELIDQIDVINDRYGMSAPADTKAEDFKNVAAEEEIENTKVEPSPETPILFEIENDKTRKEYFDLKNKKVPKAGTPEFVAYQAELKAKEDAYRAIKNKIVENLLAKGPQGQIEAKEFLTKEVELKRKSDIENGPLLGRIKTGISNTIQSWDKWGVEQKDKSGNVTVPGSITARLSKLGVSIVMTGAVSAISVQGAASMGWGTASALAGGASSRIASKLGLGVGIAAFMEKVPLSPKKKRALEIAMLVGTGALAFSGGGLAGLAAVGTASAIGVGISKLTRKYEKKISKRMNKVQEATVLDLTNLDANVRKIEEEVEQAIKRAETTRITGKLLEVAAALGGSVATLEIMGHVHDDAALKKHEGELSAQHDADAKQHAADIRALEAAKNTPATTPSASTPEHLNPEALVHKGEGIENAFIRQIEHDKDLAKGLGWDGKEDLHHFAQGEAHRLAIKEGYVSAEGQEIRVAEADKVGYEIKMEDGHAVVTEKMVDGTIVETHHEGDAFEKDEHVQKYEYPWQKGHSALPTETVPGDQTAVIGPENAATEASGNIDSHFGKGYKFGTPIEHQNLPAHEIPKHDVPMAPPEDRAYTSNPVEAKHAEVLSKYNPQQKAGENFTWNTETPNQAAINAANDARAVAIAHGAGGVNIEASTRHGVRILTPVNSRVESTVSLGNTNVHNYGVSENTIGNHFHLSYEALGQVDHAYNSSIDKLFPGHQLTSWASISHRAANDVLQNNNLEKEPIQHNPELYNNLYSFVRKLQEVTHLKPKGANIFHWKSEDTQHYVLRAMQKAREMGPEYLALVTKK